MENNSFPDHPDTCNELIRSDETFESVNFWGDLYSESPWGYAKLGGLIRIVYEVNGYFIIASLKESSGKAEKNKSNKDPDDLSDLIRFELDDLNIGELESLYATYDLSAFIREKAPDYFRKCVRADYSEMIDLKKREQGSDYYYSAFLFIDEDYNSLLKCISYFCLDEMHFCELDSEDHVVRDRTIYDSWDAGAEVNTTTLYTHASDISFAGSGIVIKVFNMKTLIPAGLFSNSYNEYLEKTGRSPGELEPTYRIPKLIFDRCSTIPHMIEVSYSRLWLYPGMGYSIVTGLAQKFPGKAFMISPDNNILEIKTNEYLSEEEKIGYLYEFSNDYLQDEQLKEVGIELESILRDTWGLLNEKSRKFLANGFFLYKQAVRGSKFLIDFSLPSIAYSKCIENEMVERIILPYKKHFETYFADEDMSADLQDNHVKRMAGFLTGKIKIPPELGTFSYFLKTAIHSKKRAKTSVCIRSFKSYCETLKDPDFLLIEDRAYHFLNRVATKYRNGSAHIKVLPLEYLIEFHEALFEKNMLQELVVSTSTG